jgi:hypothetical protein
MKKQAARLSWLSFVLTIRILKQFSGAGSPSQRYHLMNHRCRHGVLLVHAIRLLEL